MRTAALARLRIELPEKYLFSTEIAVRIGDINYGGHLGNDSVLGLFHEARLRFLKSRGYSELDAGGAGIIMVDSAVCYRSQAFHGETMKVEVAVADPDRYGCDFLYRMSDVATGREVARAKTSILFFDYGENRKTEMPGPFRAAFFEAS